MKEKEGGSLDAERNNFVRREGENARKPEEILDEPSEKQQGAWGEKKTFMFRFTE